MIVREKNAGTYVSYHLTGAVLCFREDELALDLSKYERDYPVRLDISGDENSRLLIGPSYRYIAEIDIPAREYAITVGEKDDAGFPLLTKTAVPLDTDKVTLTLWAEV